MAGEVIFLRLVRFDSTDDEEPTRVSDWCSMQWYPVVASFLPA
jgi:hypothetical protein